MKLLLVDQRTLFDEEDTCVRNCFAFEKRQCTLFLITLLQGWRSHVRFTKQAAALEATNQCEKMSCQSNIIVPGFEPATFKFESHPITTRPELPPKKKKCLVSNTKSYLAFLHSSQAFLWNKNAISIDWKCTNAHAAFAPETLSWKSY